MVNILVELIDRRNNYLGNHILHVESTFDYKNLQTFLNSLSHEPQNCKFFYQSERFKTSFDDLLKRHKLEIEQKIIVEYEIDDDNKPEESIELASAISSLLYKDDELYVAQYFSPVEVYKFKDTLLKSSTKKEIVRDLYPSVEGVLGFKNKEGLINLSSDSLILDSYEITSLLESKDSKYFGTSKGECCCLRNGVSNELYKSKYKIISIYEYENTICFVLQNGTIMSYDVDNEEVSKRKLDFIVTSVVKCGDVVFYGTSESFILNTSTNEKIEVDLRYIQSIIQVDENIIAFNDQYNLIIFNLESKSNLNHLKFENEINDTEIIDRSLFVASGKSLFRFNLNTLMN